MQNGVHHANNDTHTFTDAKDLGEKSVIRLDADKQK
jgi:hypothetical protein